MSHNPFFVPIAYSEGAREVAIDWDQQSSEEQVPQTMEERKATVEKTAAWAIRQMGNGAQLGFEVHLVPRDGHSTEPQRLNLMASIARQGLYIIIHLPCEDVDTQLPDKGVSLASLLKPSQKRAA